MLKRPAKGDEGTNTSEILRHRAMLCSARVRFSPEIQPIREQAIDGIMKHCMLIADPHTGATLRSLEDLLRKGFPTASPALTRTDIERSVQRLARAGELKPQGTGAQTTYCLSQAALEQLGGTEREAEGLFARVLGRILADAQPDASAYAQPFLECLCTIFSRLADSYVRVISGDTTREQFLGAAALAECIARTQRRHPEIDQACFEQAVMRFFQEHDPEYDLIKWNMAQNYYLMSALGMDPRGGLLSQEVFGGAVFYLDTNVVVEAVEPRSRSYRAFASLAAACRKLSVDLRVCQTSLDELRRVVDHYQDLIPRVAGQIPDSTAPNVRGIFFQLYREEIARSGTPDLEELYSHFVRAASILTGAHDVQVVQDPWLAAGVRERRTHEILAAIDRSRRQRNARPKSKGSRTHDALLLHWAERERANTGRNTWVVTLDQSLPAVTATREAHAPQALAITLDALLQWLAPIGIDSDLEAEAAAAFAEAVRYQLLPQERLFDLRDFLIFAEMGWACAQLPPQDVEDCIRHLKATAPDLDPTKPADREKLARAVSKFFVDPGRKYSAEIQRLQQQTVQLRDRQGDDIRALEESISDLQRERDETIKASLRDSARMRLALVAVIFAILEGAVAYLAQRYAAGDNLLQKLLAFRWFAILGAGLSVLIAGFFLGRTRILALGWPFTRLLRQR